MLLTLSVQSAEPTAFQEAFEINRAMYGSGHVFIWQGNTFTTDHPEEREAQMPASREKAVSMMQDAQLLNQQATARGYAWSKPAELLEQAQLALQTSEYRQAMLLAARAKYQIRMSIRQAEDALEHWRDAQPK